MLAPKQEITQLIGRAYRKSALVPASLAAEIARTNAEAYRIQLSGEYRKAVQQFLKYKTSVEFYEQSALPQAAQVQRTAQKSYERGDIGYVEYSQSLIRTLAVKTNYVESLAAYNHTVLTLELLAGNRNILLRRHEGVWKLSNTLCTT